MKLLHNTTTKISATDKDYRTRYGYFERHPEDERAAVDVHWDIRQVYFNNHPKGKTNEK